MSCKGTAPNLPLVTSSFGWRWAFLLQLPLFAISFMLSSVYLRYVTPVRCCALSAGLFLTVCAGKE